RKRKNLLPARSLVQRPHRVPHLGQALRRSRSPCRGGSVAWRGVAATERGTGLTGDAAAARDGEIEPLVPDSGQRGARPPDIGGDIGDAVTAGLVLDGAGPGACGFEVAGE